MADILDLQGGDQDDTPGAEKASNWSVLKWCYNSYISVSLCMVK